MKISKESGACKDTRHLALDTKKAGSTKNKKEKNVGYRKFFLCAGNLGPSSFALPPLIFRTLRSVFFQCPVPSD